MMIIIKISLLLLQSRWEENLGHNGYVYGLEDGDGFMGIYLLQTLQVVNIKYI